MSYFYGLFFYHCKRSFADDSSASSPSFLDRVFGTKVEKATQAHSVLLADQQILYELQSAQFFWLLYFFRFKTCSKFSFH